MKLLLFLLMFKIVYLLIFFSYSFVDAQNWIDVTDMYIKNPSFEDYTECPLSNSDYPNSMWIDSCVGWTAPTKGTSDYFNSCNTNLFNSVPYNTAAGFQFAYDGNGYCGFLAYSLYNERMWSEYIQTELMKNLQKNHFYKFSMRIVRANDYNLSVSKIGCHFSAKNLQDYTTFNPYNFTPSILNENGFINDTVNWMKIEGVFKSVGDEKFLTIGWFGDTISNDKFFLIPPSIDSVSGEEIYLKEIYYLVDSLKLFESEKFNIDLNLPNVFSVNGDGVNDFYTYTNDLIKSFNFQIINRWGNIIYENTLPNIFWNGLTNEGKIVSSGTYFIQGQYINLFDEKYDFHQFIYVTK